MTRTTWDEQELPLLRRLAEEPPLEREGDYYAFAATLDLNQREASEMLSDLKAAGFVDFQLPYKGLTAHFVSIRGLRLAPGGRRSLGLWPSDESQAEQLVEAMIAELDKRIEAADTDEERSKLRAVLSGLGGASRQIAVSVLTELAKRSTGLS